MLRARCMRNLLQGLLALCDYSILPHNTSVAFKKDGHHAVAQRLSLFLFGRGVRALS